MGMLAASSKIKQILNEEKIDYDEVLKVLSELRGGQQVTDMEPEIKISGFGKIRQKSYQTGTRRKIRPGNWQRRRNKKSNASFKQKNKK